MSATTYSTDDAIESGHLSHAWDGLVGRRIPYVLYGKTEELISGAGGVITSARDMVHLNPVAPLANI